jgi:1,4-alpha-glucan branching enzyme
LAPPEKLRAGLAILLLSPQVPMLFMGEEYGAVQPFLYFCDYHGELAEAISKGRRNEFASFGAFADEQQRQQIPDPDAEQTYLASQLDADDQAEPPHREWLAYTQALLTLRAERLVPLIPEIVPGAARCTTDDRKLTVTWPLKGNRVLVMEANCGDDPKPAVGAAQEKTKDPIPRPVREREQELWYSTAGASARDEELGPWEVRLWLGVP